MGLNLDNYSGKVVVTSHLSYGMAKYVKFCYIYRVKKFMTMHVLFDIIILALEASTEHLQTFKATSEFVFDL
jgi:hypothetical protein